MPEVVTLHPLLGGLLLPVLLLLGAYTAAVINGFLDRVGRSAADSPLSLPLRQGCFLMYQHQSCTERPDMVLWGVAPAVYAAMAACAMTVVPLATMTAVADVRTGIVLFGAAEALAIVAIFLHGWSPNSHLALIGGYRFVALGLSYELLSMFVLIAASLPAESLQVSKIVLSQEGFWNVIRQPLGLPLWMVVTLGVTFTGPLNLADSADLASGTSLEISGRQRLLWKIAQGAMLMVFSAMGSAVLLGGWLGPVLPGWAWMGVKTLLLMVLVVWVGRRIGRLSAERAVLLLWTVGLPLSFLHLLLAGIEALL